MVALLVQSGLAASNGEATRLIRGGGVHVNDRRIADEKMVLTKTDAIDGEIFIVQKGKKDKALVRIARA